MTPAAWNALVFVAIAAGVHALLLVAAGRAACRRRPVVQALARLVTLLPAYLHELAHASVSIVMTGRARIHLYSVHKGSERDDEQVALGATDTFFWGPIGNALVSSAPAWLLWPAATWLAIEHIGDGSALAAAAVGILGFAGRLSSSDIEHLRAPGR